VPLRRAHTVIFEQSEIHRIVERLQLAGEELRAHGARTDTVRCVVSSSFIETVVVRVAVVTVVSGATGVAEARRVAEALREAEAGKVAVADDVAVGADVWRCRSDWSCRDDQG
jgi:hypothetical protein